jgi:hypothetical protein
MTKLEDLPSAEGLIPAITSRRSPSCDGGYITKAKSIVNREPSIIVINPDDIKLFWTLTSSDLIRSKNKSGVSAKMITFAKLFISDLDPGLTTEMRSKNP